MDLDPQQANQAADYVPEAVRPELLIFSGSDAVGPELSSVRFVRDEPRKRSQVFESTPSSPSEPRIQFAIAAESDLERQSPRVHRSSRVLPGRRDLQGSLDGQDKLCEARQQYTDSPDGLYCSLAS